jgi:hypothetical protein
MAVVWGERERRDRRDATLELSSDARRPRDVLWPARNARATAFEKNRGDSGPFLKAPTRVL